MQILQAFKRTLKDPLGLVSFVYIVFLVCMAVFADLVVPDKSPYANQMHLSIHSKPPGFETMLLQRVDENGNLMEEIPVQATKWESNQLFYLEEGLGATYFKPLVLTGFPEGTTYEIVEKEYLKKTSFIWGTDKFGRDLFSRMVFGTRISLSIGFVAVFISLLLGVFLGGIGGFLGGRTDQVVLWLINVVWSIPSLLMVIAITLALGKGFWQVFIAVGLTMWVEVARLTRGLVISIKEQTHVDAARVLGFSPLRIFTHHIFPLLIPSLIVLSTANFASAILIESGLSFLGIGAQPPIPSWGGMIKDHYRYIILGKPYLAIIPGIAIMSVVLAFMLIGNSLRDALDVKG